MLSKTLGDLEDGQYCTVVGGTHAGKSGNVKDINTRTRLSAAGSPILAATLFN
jgi:ribosomal protein S4E